MGSSFSSKMGDYIRGKKAYTKWDADSENIDIEYRPDSQRNQPQEGCLSGTKGKVIMLLVTMLVFCLGIIVGFLIRRGMRDVLHFHPLSNSHHEEEMKPYAFTIENCQKLQNEIQADSIKAFLKNYTMEPHIAGKLSSKKYINHVVDLWKSWGIENVRLETFKVLLSYPSSDTANKVHLLNTENNSPLQVASESGDDELHSDLRPYLAYSPNRHAEGKLVYANYGRKEDFDYLISQNISLNGSVIIMRLGKIHRTNKVRFAEKFNASGVLLYPDPIDYVNSMEIYPEGLGLPGDSVIRGSLNYFPGDPQNPSQAATNDAVPIDNWKVGFRLPNIPVQPISYNDALRFMSNMTGPEVPKEWTGGLNMTYHLGPGHSLGNGNVSVTLSIFNELKEAEVHNIIGNIKGKFEPDRYVIVGNHHDSWTNGTGDPGTGLAVFLEVVRAFAHLKNTGWEPSRTIVFAAWDAEEFGMIGSTEWLKLHQKELHSRAVAYVNTDAVLKGNSTLMVQGSPLLQQAVALASKLILFPHQKPPTRDEELKNRLFATMTIPDTTENASDVFTPRLSILGSDSDYASFMGMLGISSVNLQFVSKDKDNVDSYRLYHSAYDNFDAVEKFIDPGFQVSRALAQFSATLILLLSDSFVLPMNPEDYGKSVLANFYAFKKDHEQLLSSKNISLDDLENEVKKFNETCKMFHNNFTAVNMNDESLGYHEYNDRALELERSLINSDWETGNHFRHVIFGPHPYNLEEGVAYPHLLTALLAAKNGNYGLVSWKHVERNISQVIAALRSASMVLSSDVITNQRGAAMFS